MRILVTGAAGFIGSHTCQRLLAEYHDVVGVDNFDPFYARAAKEANLSQAKASPRFEFIEADLAEEAAVAAVFQRGPFDVVLHLAAKAGVRPSIQDPLGYYRANIVATLNLCQRMIRQQPLPKLVFASNGHGIALAAQDKAFHDTFTQADIMHVDGQAAVWASNPFSSRYLVWCTWTAYQE